MNIMVNCTVLTGGGGITVADSLCSYLGRYPQHSFYIVLSPETEFIKDKVEEHPNVRVFVYRMRRNFKTLLLHRDKYLDGFVKRNSIDAVVSVFGPTHWTPKCLHLCGFARPHIVFPDSPFFSQLSLLDRFKQKIFYKFMLWQVRKNANAFYTENPMVSVQLEKLIPGSKVETITNNYHQIFDNPESWSFKKLPDFNGTTLLIFTTPSLHKNIPITVDIARCLKLKHPDFKFRFAITISRDELKGFTEDLSEQFLFLGRVKIEDGPSIYKQSDIMFLPSLLECFSANYAEAMRMGIPIITTDLEFARGTCGEAACYYSPLSAENAADAIYRVSTDSNFKNTLIQEGIRQVRKFDTPSQRADKIVKMVERMVKSQNL